MRNRLEYVDCFLREALFTSESVSGLTEIITTYGRRHVRQFYKRCSKLHFQAWIAMVSKELFQTTVFQKLSPEGSKTWLKSGPRTCLHPFLIRVFEDFFSVFSQPLKIHNSNYQCPATLRHPPYPPRKNQLFSVRTNGRTSPNCPEGAIV